MELTISGIKADVGSKGGHTEPSTGMLECVREIVATAKKDGIIIDGFVFHVGDDIELIMSHTRGKGDEVIHREVALKAFHAATAEARRKGLYAAGQDLLKDAPSGNLRGLGPGVAEIEFDHDPAVNSHRRAESFMVMAVDKCGPGAFNFPVFRSFADPAYCSGLILQPTMHKGFTFEIIDMDRSSNGKTRKYDAPEDWYKIEALLSREARHTIQGIWSRQYPGEQAAASTAERLHNIAGKYPGKDDSLVIIRNQGIFPAPEELLSPWMVAHFVGGGARGGHNMPIMPVPINTAVTGAYCLPVVCAVGFSVAPDGTFADEYIDFFDNLAWDYTRQRAQQKALEMRLQGCNGVAMQGEDELEYGGYREIVTAERAGFTFPTDEEKLVEDQLVVSEVSVEETAAASS